MNDILFETDRTFVRQVQEADLPAIQAIKEANWHELQKWMVWASNDQKSFKALLHNFETQVRHEYERGGRRLCAFDKDTGELVICGGLSLTDRENTYATGYFANPAYQGQGFATEVTKGTLKFAFDTHGAEKILINYYEGNTASQRVIEKCGFTFFRTKPYGHRSFATGEWLDVHCHYMTQLQWREKTCHL